MPLFSLELNPAQIALLTVAVGGTGWVVLHRLAANREKSGRHAAACAAFRAAVMLELGSVYPVPNPWPGNIDAFLRERFNALQTAVQVFGPFVANRSEFDAAWLAFYCAYPTKTREQCYHHYFASFDPTLGTQEQADRKARAEFKTNVARLLQFADAT